MGARDTEEMLEACKAQGIQDERQITHLQRKLDAITNLLGDHPQTDHEHRIPASRIREILDRKDTP